MEAAFSINARFARFLIEEAGAPVNERSPRGGRAALHFCGETETMALLFEAGADIEAQDDPGGTPLFWCVSNGRSAPAQLLLERGASADVVDSSNGMTPLIYACTGYGWFLDERWPVFQNLLRGSSNQTRRLVVHSNGRSAADTLAYWQQQYGTPSNDEDRRTQERRCWAISELLASGASVQPRYVPVLLPIAAALSARQLAELAARRSEPRCWRAHEAFVGLALDQRELREAAQTVEAKRLEVLELGMCELGDGSERDANEEEDEDEIGSDFEDEGERESETGDSEGT